MPETKGTSVLGALTASVMAEKSKAASKPALTPVPSERNVRLPDVPGDFLTDEGLADVAKDLRRHAAYMLKVADGIDAMRGKEPSAPDAPVSIEDARKAKEREADARAAVAAAKDPEKFMEDFNAKAAAAQAATFNAEPGSVSAPDGSWLCPLHGKVKDKTTKSGRPYRGCPDCNLFERT